MKYRILSDELFAHLQSVSRVIVQKNTIPILGNVLFEFRGDRLILTASDGDTRLVTSFEVQAEEPADISVAISSKQLLEPLREIPRQEILLSIDPENYEVKCEYNSGHFQFRAQSGDTYPEVSSFEKDPIEVRMPTKVFLSGVNYTIFSTSNDEVRPITTGIYFDLKQDHIVFVATDGFLLSMYTNHNVQPGVEMGFILQKKPANILKNLLDKEDAEEVFIQVYDNYARITAGGIEMHSRLIDGKYPNYAAVIPRDNDKVIEADREHLLGSLRRVSIFSNQAINLVNFEVSEDRLYMKTSDLDFSTAGEEDVKISYKGEPLTIAFRATHLMDVLSNLSSEDVSILLGDPTKPGLISPIQIEEGENVTALVMPLKR